MGLINDDVLETELLESALLDETDFVRGNADVEVLRDESIGDDLGTLFFGAREQQDVDVGRPVLELTSPVLQRGFRYDDKMGAVYLTMMLEVGEEGNRLESFSETLEKEQNQYMDGRKRRSALTISSARMPFNPL